MLQMEPYYAKVKRDTGYLQKYVPSKQNAASRVDSDRHPHTYCIAF